MRNLLPIALAVVLSFLFIEQYIILHEERPEKTEMVH